MIIAMLASMVLFALFRAQEEARSRKTSALIARLDAIVKSKWESYKTRRVPVRIGPDQFRDLNGNGVRDGGEQITFDWNNNNALDGPPSPIEAARLRMDALLDLMRMEMPERYTDIVEVQVGGTLNPANPARAVTAIPEPALWQSYLRRIVSASSLPTVKNQGAECLYLIVMNAVTDEADARDIFKEDNIGDVDNDGMPEFIDGWGRPIKFLRWAPGFQSDLQIVARGTVSFADVGPPVTVQLTGAPPSTSSGTFVGGVMAVLDSQSASLPQTPINPDRMGKITDYQFNGTNGVFTIAPPANSTAPVFNGSPPMVNQQVVILAPDPLDPLGVYPIFPEADAMAPTTSRFALYPLIYSAGPDGGFGVLADVDDPSMGVASWSYPQAYLANFTSGRNPYDINPYGINPFVGHSSSTMPPFRFLFGALANIQDEPNNAAPDNIHNHLLNAN